MHLLKILVKKEVIISFAARTNLGGISSGPGAELALMLLELPG